MEKFFLVKLEKISITISSLNEERNAYIFIAKSFYPSSCVQILFADIRSRLYNHEAASMMTAARTKPRTTFLLSSSTVAAVKKSICTHEDGEEDEDEKNVPSIPLIS